MRRPSERGIDQAIFRGLAIKLSAHHTIAPRPKISRQAGCPTATRWTAAAECKTASRDRATSPASLTLTGRKGNDQRLARRPCSSDTRQSCLPRYRRREACCKHSDTRAAVSPFRPSRSAAAQSRFKTVRASCRGESRAAGARRPRPSVSPGGGRRWAGRLRCRCISTRAPAPPQKRAILVIAMRE